MAKPQCEFRRHIIGIILGCYLGFLGRSNCVQWLCSRIGDIGYPPKFAKIWLFFGGLPFFTDQSRKKGKSWDLILDIWDFGVPKIQGY